MARIDTLAHLLIGDTPMNKTLVSIALFALAALPTTRAHADAAGDIGERIVAVFERMGADVAANKPDCDKIGAALMKHADADATVLADAKKLDAGKTAAQKKAAQAELQKKFGARMSAAQQKMAPLKDCRTNATIKSYMAKVGM